ncbi:MAG TPA: ribosome silencing factor [Planctomycetota bacterium]|nr:ribosome silencing factor [Planctomycetota bacterium]
MTTEDLIRQAIAIAIDKKGLDLRVLDVAKGLSITDWFILVSAESRRQAQAIAAAIDVEMKHAGVPKARIEGYSDGWWILLDFDTVVVHVFQDEARSFYALDKLWADAKDRTKDFVPAEALRSTKQREQGADSDA